MHLSSQSKSSRRDIEAHSEKPKIVERIIAAPPRANGCLQLLYRHSGTVIANGYCRVFPIGSRQRHDNLRRANWLSNAPRVDKRVDAVVNQLREALPLIEVNFA